jgi:hypothetical protein
MSGPDAVSPRWENIFAVPHSFLLRSSKSDDLLLNIQYLPRKMVRTKKRRKKFA